MNWEDSAEDIAFRGQVRDFLQQRFPADYPPEGEAEHSLEPEDPWGYNWPADRVAADPVRRSAARRWAAALAEKGWIVPHWPVAYGGASLPPLHEFILQEELMRAGVPAVNSIGAFLLGPTLLHHGTEEQRAQHLPSIAQGETTWAQGFSEPEAGSDLASLRTAAYRDGDHYVVRGQKVWTSLAQYADWLFVLVRTDPAAAKHKGISFLLVDAASPGVTIRPIEDIRGAAPFCEVFLDDVRVPIANRVGDENQGWIVAMTALSFERAGIGATIKFERALQRLITHVAGEGPTGPCPLYHEIARRYMEVRVQHNLARYTVSKLASGTVPGYEASVNQLYGAELFQRLADTGAKAMGSSAQLWQREGAPLDAVFTHLRMDAVASTFLGGSTEIQRNLIATRGLGMPRGS